MSTVNETLEMTETATVSSTVATAWPSQSSGGFTSASTFYNPTAQADVEKVWGNMRYVLNAYIIPFLIIYGLISNTVVVVFFNRSSLKRNSLSVYISTLVVADILIVSFDGIEVYMRQVFSYHIKNASSLTCKLFFFIVHTCGFASAWTVVAVALERVYVVVFPFRAKIVTSRRRAAIVTACMVTVVVALESYQFFVRSVESDTCVCPKAYSIVCRYVNPISILVGINLLPVAILITSNSILIYHLAKARRLRSKMTTSNAKGDQRFLAVAVAMCTSYVCLMTPLGLFYLVFYINGFQRDPMLTFVEDLVNTLANVNYVGNLVFFVLCNKRLRQEMKVMMMKAVSCTGKCGQCKNQEQDTWRM